MKILIIGGFLGSGKTTMLLDIARYAVEHSTSDSSNKVAIIENEVGEIGIDDKLLAGGGMEVKNLFAGCVCCTLVGGLMDTAKEIETTQNPDYLILETTGVAYPGTIRETFADAMGYESRTVTIADCSRWKRVRGPLSVLINGQMEGADVVVLNKCDLASDEDIDLVLADVKEINPQAAVYYSSVDSPLTPEQLRVILGMD